MLNKNVLNEPILEQGLNGLFVADEEFIEETKKTDKIFSKIPQLKKTNHNFPLKSALYGGFGGHIDDYY